MASDLEEQKKAVLPFMQRAQEIQQADPKVAYYCRMYAVEQALKLPHRAKEITGLVSATLNQMERDKAHLKLDPDADRIHCLGFALRIFDNADRVDRAGKASERTSKAYYAASVFIEILNQFEGGVDAELLEKQRYCAWRAAEIRKALREGRQPTPPPSANPPPAAADAAAASAPALDDLPAASGSSDWAYSAPQGQAPLPPTPPQPPLSGGSFTGVNGSAGGRMMGGDSFHRATNLAPAAAPVAASAPAATAAGAGEMEGTRFWPGAKVLVRTEEGLEDVAVAAGEDGSVSSSGGVQLGTVGQVIRRPNGGVGYKVALTDRLVELPDEAAVPALQPGSPARLLPVPHQQQQQPLPGGPGGIPVTVLHINQSEWPPIFLVRTPDGKEHAVTAQQLGPPLREATAAAAAPLPPPPPPPPSQPAEPAALPPLYSQQPPLYPQQPSAPPAPPPPAPRPSAPSASGLPEAYGGAAARPAASPPGPWGPPPIPGGHLPPPVAPPAPVAPPSYPHSYSGPVPGPAAAAPPASTAHVYSVAAPAPAPVPSLPPGYKPSVQVITESQKQAKYAVSALSFEDVPTAVKHLTEALRLLTSPAPVLQGAHGAGRR